MAAADSHVGSSSAGYCTWLSSQLIEIRQLVAPGGVGRRFHVGCVLSSNAQPASDIFALVCLPAASTRNGDEACASGRPSAPTSSRMLLARRRPATAGGNVRSYS